MLLTLLSVSGCQTAGLTGFEVSAVANDYNIEPQVCEVWHPFIVSALDAHDTRRQAAGNNSARKAYGCKTEKVE
jgi:hypothetical protein